jgi:AAA domain
LISVNGILSITGRKMPTLDKLERTDVCKGLMVAPSGSGKSGALASLVKAGKKLVIADFDNGTQILMDPKVLPPSLRSQVYVEKFIDRKIVQGGKAVTAGVPTAFTKFLDSMNNWPELGPITSLDSSHVFVLDSLTFCGKAAMRYTLSLAGKLTNVENNKARVSLPNWGTAGKFLEGLLDILYSDVVKCHVIINTHLKLIGGDEKEKDQNKDSEDLTEKKQQDTMKKLAEIAAQSQSKSSSISSIIENEAEEAAAKYYPNALGRALPMEIGRYFNTVVSMKTGIGDKRYIITRSFGGLDLKVPFPSLIPEVLPIEDGWAKILQAFERKE